WSAADPKRARVLVTRSGAVAATWSCNASFSERDVHERFAMALPKLAHPAWVDLDARCFRRTSLPICLGVEQSRDRSAGRMRCGGTKPSIVRGLLFLALVLVWASRAVADAPVEIGRTILVVNDVQGRLGEEPPMRIVLNDGVLFQEDVLTADKAQTILEFRDGSTFEVGPGAAVRIDAFVFNPDESVSRKVVSVGHGVFRYISGLTANQQETKILTSNGALAVRGSVAAGIVDSEVPNFIYVGEGSAVFTNDSGSTELRPDDAIAVPSRTTAVMQPQAMPPAIAAQALQAIERRLPPGGVLRRRPPPDEAWLGAPAPPIWRRSPSNCSGKPRQAHELLWR